MDRFNEETAAGLVGNATRARFAEEIYESQAQPLDGPTCENCGRTVDRVTPVPQFEYLGCDDCMVEALNQIAREQRRMMADAGCTVEEIAASFPVRSVVARRIPEVA
jgi:hypothetical protein